MRYRRRSKKVRAVAQKGCAAAESGVARARTETRACACALVCADLSLIQELCAEAGLTRAEGEEEAPPPKRRRRRDDGSDGAAAAAGAASSEPLAPSLAYVLVYELLFGAGCEPSGDAERAVCAAEASLRTALRARLKKARAARTGAGS